MTGQKLLDAIRRECPHLKIITTPVRWRDCDDVPRFLRMLDEAEKAARESKLIVKESRR